jgi:transglutaminase-like putative cysteine protease
MTTTATPPGIGARAHPGAATPSRNRVSSGGILGPSVASAGAVILASIALGPLFDSGSWFGATVVTVVVVVAVGGVATWARLPLFLVPIAQALALFSILVARFGTDAPLGFVPTPDAMAGLREILSTGMSEVDRFAPPVPYSTGVSAVTAIGLGCVAIVVFVLQVNLRMPVVAGLALIAVYVVPSFVLDDGAPWWAFAAVAVAWMVLLISDERVGLVSWGRLLRRSEGGAASSAMSGLSSAALRLGALAIVAAIALPILVPSLADAVLGRHNTGFGSATGSGDNPSSVGLDPFVSLRRDKLQQPDVVLFRYTTEAAAPSYLRVVVLEQYANEKWSARAFDPATGRRITDDLALETSIGAGVATTAQTYALTADKLDNAQLPVPENATRIQGLAGQWYDDTQTGTIFGVDSTTKDALWKADALDATPTPEQLQASVIGNSPDLESLRSTSNVPASLGELARTVTASGTTNFAKAVLLQKYFRDNFTYSQAAGGDQSTSALDSFLRDRSGYCQQFSATMALMARSLGIPARVVVGYTPGTKGADGIWVVKGKDAHAWPELLFPGVGWVRFEPTPSSAANGSTVTVPVYATQVPVATPTSEPTAKPSSTSGSGKLDNLLAEGSPGTTPFDGPAAATTADQWRARGLVALLVVALLLAAVPATWRWLRRRRRMSATASVEDAWEELRDTARDLGIEWSDARTPRQAVARVIERQRLSGSVAEAATRVGRVTERSRYAATPPSTDGLTDDVSTVRTALLDRVDRPTRLRAALLPASLRRSED